jgi:hypothetical protein
MDRAGFGFLALLALAILAPMLDRLPQRIIVDGVPLPGDAMWQALWSQIAPNFGNGRASGSVPGVER